MGTSVSPWREAISDLIVTLEHLNPTEEPAMKLLDGRARAAAATRAPHCLRVVHRFTLAASFSPGWPLSRPDCVLVGYPNPLHAGVLLPLACPWTLVPFPAQMPCQLRCACTRRLQHPRRCQCQMRTRMPMPVTQRQDQLLRCGGVCLVLTIHVS